ncbi:MAG: hypothetical protein ACKOS8_11850, partial [Gemmataceae bacterium]
LDTCPGHAQVRQAGKMDSGRLLDEFGLLGRIFEKPSKTSARVDNGLEDMVDPTTRLALPPPYAKDPMNCQHSRTRLTKAKAKNTFASSW